MPVHHEPHAARMLRVGRAEDSAHLVGVGDHCSPGTALEALVREHHARIRGFVERRAEPLQLVRRDPVYRRHDRPVEVVALAVVDVLARLVAEVVRVEYDKAKAAPVEGVVSALQPVRLQGLLVRRAVLLVVADHVVARYAEVVVAPHEVADRRLRDVLHHVPDVNHHVAALRLGTRKDPLEELRRVVGVDAGREVQVGEDAHLERA